MRHPAHRRRPRSRQRVLRQGPRVRPAGLRRRRRGGDRRGLGGHLLRQDPGPRGGPGARPRRRRDLPRLVPNGRHPQVEAGNDDPRKDARRGNGRLPGHPLQPGDPLRPLHGRLPQRPHRHRRDGHPAPAVLRRREGRQGLHRLREMRRHLPGPGHHPRRLSQGPGLPDRDHPLRVPQGQPRRPGDEVVVEDTEGQPLGRVEVGAVKAIKANDRTVIVKVRAPRRIRQADRRHPDPGRPRRPSPWPSTSSGPPTTPSSAAASG